MLVFAIAKGLFAKQNSLLGARSQTRKLWSFETKVSESPFVRCKLTEFNHSSGLLVRSYNGLYVSRAASYCRGGNFKPSVIKTRGFAAIRPYDVKTNLPKDVLLYRYENPKYFRRLNFFGISQLLLWAYLAYFVRTELRDVPVDEAKRDQLPWWARVNLGGTTQRTILTTLVFLVGYTMFALVWLHTLKSVRYLVLRKGGQDVTFVTYTPLGHNRLRTVPLDKVNAKESRLAAKVQLPIKVKGDLTHYLLDMRGEFRHPELFDFTAGLKRPM